MNKITIITGTQGTGKSRKALQLVEGKKFYYSESPDLNKVVMYMPFDTEVLIIEDVYMIKTLKRILNIKKGYVRRPYKEKSEEVLVPDLVITTLLTKEELKNLNYENLTFIHL